MKSTIFSILPFVGLAFAQESACSAEPEETITETSVETVYKTASSSPALVADTTTSPGACGPRSTVSVTTTEKVYVTVSLSSGVPVTPDAVQTKDVTSTSTLDLYTTVTVHPSGPYFGNSSTVALFKLSSLATTLLSSASATHTPISPPRPSTVSSVAAPKPTSSTPSAATASSSAVPAASATAVPTKPNYQSKAGTTKHGSATWYSSNLSGGTCSFTGYTIPAGIYGTALSDFNWDSAANCGTCVSVTGPKGNSIKAMVVDECPGCGPNHLDLFPDAFAAIDSPNAGNITVDWTIVPCGISSPIVLKNKSGTSKFWFSMQVMNSNVGVAKLEVSTDGGATWKATQRQPYNFFENAAGFGTDAVDVKVTSTDGGVVTVKDVSIKSGTTKTAAGNFA
ncbi:Rare lipo A [Pyrenophora seminiperda CCB06]|uniref:Rare lipo A n=1 Tax=Pyrenophora seminiperda CCB06 TaxID=1302712 RepID=A0A3M7MFZ4_9PLEO|nr:Rare lipo A [Pyrenophora seminiperda CCB06]